MVKVAVRTRGSPSGDQWASLTRLAEEQEEYILPKNNPPPTLLLLHFLRPAALMMYFDTWWVPTCVGHLLPQPCLGEKRQREPGKKNIEMQK